VSVEFIGEIHPFADLFPMLGEDDLSALAESIRDEGLLTPLTLSPDGTLLDGRNRLAACERAGVDPVFEVYEGDPFAFVVASNINRRHLSAGQQAMGIAISLTEQGKRQDGRFAYGSVREATANSHDSGNLGEYVRRAGVVVDNDYPTARLVLSGAVPLSVAYDNVVKALKEAAEADARLASLRDRAADLAAQVDDGTLTLAEAWAAYQVRDAKRIAREKAEQDAIDDWNRSLHTAIALLSRLSNDEWMATAVANYQPESRTTGATVKEAIDGLARLKKGLRL